MIRSVSIGNRLYGAFTVLLALIIILGVSTYFNLREMDDLTNTIEQHRVPSLAAINDINIEFQRGRLNAVNVLTARTAEARQEYETQLVKVNNELEDAKTRYASLIRTPETRALYEDFLAMEKRYWSLQQNIQTQALSGDEDGAFARRDRELTPLAREVSAKLTALLERQRNRIQETSALATQAYVEASSQLVITIIALVVLVVVMARVITRSLVKPISEAARVADAIANNDLTAEIDIDGNDEATALSRSLNNMQKNLRQTVSLIGDSSHQLATACEELNLITKDAEQNQLQQARELEQASSAVNELTVSIEEVATNATETAKESQQANDKTDYGAAQVKRTVSSIESLVATIKSSSANTEELSKQVGNVRSVLEVIRGIAEQTNLLALNAAIEAARAGEAGRGFAVVADEVRALASRTKDSTTEIEEIVKAVESGTDATVKAMGSSQSQAATTLEAGNEGSEALVMISSLIQLISDRNTGTASAVEQQSLVAREVDRNLVRIRDLASANNDGAKQITASSAELAKLADQLSAVVRRFKT
ncbi:methyl-accepting chemotaxis protein [Aliiglaciecola sp. CAU 1673]|uniref:methyl-accepting chemotaxis protein n=1 Tax=Aliiglaciecola sp. CAU 1673 TaxID=3032595 RepID=UPI0023DBAA2E|nr:methyl-accepting chemotaxis protein [Aliiglaciecola sp. CAU 1673]MDF2179016.1 methyl-accepting chemotaxis protein [Aliiglaciecola sp. CAU 1673]